METYSDRKKVYCCCEDDMCMYMTKLLLQRMGEQNDKASNE